MDILLLIAVTVSCAMASIVSAMYSRKDKTDPFLFTALAAVASGIFFFAYNKFRFTFDIYTLEMSLLFALCYLTCLITTYYAYKRGSVAISSMISSFSLLLPTLFGIVYWHEQAKWLFWVGIVLFCISVVLVNLEPSGNRRPDQKTKRLDPLWIIFVAAVFFTNGGCSIVQTYHQKTGGQDFKAEFMITAMLLVAVINAVIAVCVLRKKTPAYMKKATVYGAAYGVVNGLCNLGVMLLASGGVINQSVFFPVISIGSLVLVLVASVLLFREKLTRVQVIGIAFGIASIVMLQL